MGAGASAKSSTILSAASLPNQLFVEGGGCPRVNGKFVLRTDKDAHNFPSKVDPTGKCNQSAWFSKEDDESCWMGFLDSDSQGDGKNAESEPTDGRKWIIFTAQELLYVAPNNRGEVLSPRQGRWEVGANGAAPAPTVNLQPLPAPFQLSGWKGPHSCLNGEYMPSDDGSKLLNNRPIFKHAPIVLGWKREDRYRMYWSHGAWRISDKDKLQSDQAQCMAFAKSDATHPTDMRGVVWKATRRELDYSGNENDFELAEGVSVATGTVRVVPCGVLVLVWD